ncbi:OB-fold protein [Nannocystis bainbridge]|uniref:tRNA_anti-like n=1 Tax=Nannocystis bainbridge TaxID=2995303 RepID=A0ABT5E1A7_9BACT|nr:hypothetical protein [Nannocystis bainbridge]MDC0719109.1 hypothetical protein [Nannocystis bainbridge]
MANQEKKRGIGFYLLVGVGALFVISIISRDKNTSPTTSTSAASAARPSSAPEPPKAPQIDARVTARELFEAYEKNEIAADNRFKDKLLEVSGKVDNVGKDLLDTPYVALSTGGKFDILGVQAFFDDASLPKLANLSKGQDVTVACRCDGKFGNVMLKECTLK